MAKKIKAELNIDGYYYPCTRAEYVQLETDETLQDKLNEINNKIHNQASILDLNNKVDKIDGYSLISNDEIARLSQVYNYDDTDIRTRLSHKSDFSGSYYDLVNIPTNLATIEYVNEVLGNINNNGFDYNDVVTYIDGAIGNKADKSEIPTQLSQLYNDTQYISQIPEEYVVSSQLEQYVLLNQLNDYITTEQLSSQLQDYVTFDKLEDFDFGDFDTELFALKTDIPTNISQLQNDMSFITMEEVMKKGYVNEQQVSSTFAKQTDMVDALDSKVDREDGKTLISIAELERLSQLQAYDDTAILQRIFALEQQYNTLSQQYNELKEQYDSMINGLADAKSLANDILNGDI